MRRRIAVVIAAAVVLVLALNVVGLARYPGGPLREKGSDGPLWLDTWPADWGNSSTGNGSGADWATTDTDLVFSIVWIANQGPWPVTVEGITPAGVSGDLVVTDVRVRDADASAGDLWAFGPLDDAGRAILDSQYQALPVTLPAGSERQVALVVRGATPGPAGFEALDVAYRMGPLTFRAVQHLGLEGCLGATVAERDCPDED